MKIFLSIILAMMVIMPASAQESVATHRLVVDIPFVLAGSKEKDIHEKIDSVKLAKSMRELRSLASDKAAKVKAVEFYGSVSPEGPYLLNKRLGRERLATAESIIRSILPISDSVVVTRDERFIPWDEYLLPAVESDTIAPYREELIEILSTGPENGVNGRRARLMRAHNGKLWELIGKRYFDHMRKGGAIITVDRIINDELPILRNPFKGVIPASEDALYFEEPAPKVDSISEPVKMNAVSIKTNAGAVAALVTNIGFEVKLAQRWSLDVMGAYSPYNMIVNDRKIRLFGVRPEARFWWGEPMKRGHFLGLHGFTYAFNVQVGDKYRYQDPNHALWGVGLAYGYALPLGKKERWGVEFTLGLGYARIKYDKYDGAVNGPFLERKLINYFGPTRLGINFSYRFDVEGKQKKKNR